MQRCAANFCTAFLAENAAAARKGFPAMPRSFVTSTISESNIPVLLLYDGLLHFPSAVAEAIQTQFPEFSPKVLSPSHQSFVWRKLETNPFVAIWFWGFGEKANEKTNDTIQKESLKYVQELLRVSKTPLVLVVPSIASRQSLEEIQKVLPKHAVVRISQWGSMENEMASLCAKECIQRRGKIGEFTLQISQQEQFSAPFSSKVGVEENEKSESGGARVAQPVTSARLAAQISAARTSTPPTDLPRPQQRQQHIQQQGVQSLQQRDLQARVGEQGVRRFQPSQPQRPTSPLVREQTTRINAPKEPSVIRKLEARMKTFSSQQEDEKTSLKTARDFSQTSSVIDEVDRQFQEVVERRKVNQSLFSHLPEEKPLSPGVRAAQRLTQQQLLERRNAMNGNAIRKNGLVKRGEPVKQEKLLEKLFQQSRAFGKDMSRFDHSSDHSGGRVGIDRTDEVGNDISFEKKKKDKGSGGKSGLFASFAQIAVLLFLVFITSTTAITVLFSVAKEKLFRNFVTLQDQLISGMAIVQPEVIDQYEQQSRIYQSIASVAYPVFRLFGRDAFIQTNEEEMSMLKKTYTSMQSLSDFSIAEGQYVQSVFSATGKKTPIEALQRLLLSTDTTAKDISLFLAELASWDQASHESTTLRVSELRKTLASFRRDVYALQHFLSVAPQFFGRDEKKTYVVIIQNPLEIRPTGGFISTVGIATFDGGKLLDVQFQDSYAVDQLLNGKVQPPNDLQKYLRENQWYLRDSNWNPDFPRTARQAEWFVQKEMGLVADGTIAINVYTLQALLRVTGPITLKGYNNEQVTADNIFERLHTRTELNFQLKESAKKEYLTEIAQELLIAIQGADETKSKEIGRALLQSFDSNQLFVSVLDAEQEHVFSSLGWNGKVATPLCPQQFSESPCTVDTFFAVETNVGINRANYDIQRSANHDVLLTQSSIEHTYTLQLENVSQSNAWPSGTYKNYVRLYLPTTAEVRGVSVNGQPIQDSAISQTIEGEKKMIGFYVEVPIKTKASIMAKYTVPAPSAQAFSYAFFVQKQAGTDAYPTRLTITVDKDLRMKTVAPEAVMLDRVVQFVSTMEKHQYVAVEVVRQE